MLGQTTPGTSSITSTKGYDERLRRLIPIRLSTGELTGYIGITEAKLPKEFHLSNVVTFPKKSA